MFVRRRKNVARKIRKGKGMRRSRVPRAMSLKTTERTFSEMFAGAPLLCNSGTNDASGVLTVSLSSLPQVASYSQLYRQFCIRKVTWTLIPRFNSADQNGATYNGLVASSTGWSLGRFTYSIADTPGVVAPTNEIQVLQDNGAKIVSTARKIVITHRPKPNLFDPVQISSNPLYRINAPVWFNTDATGQGAYSGTGVIHGGVRWFLQVPANGATSQPFVTYDVYGKITFSVRDPC